MPLTREDVEKIKSYILDHTKLIEYVENDTNATRAMIYTEHTNMIENIIKGNIDRIKVDKIKDIYRMRNKEERNKAIWEYAKETQHNVTSILTGEEKLKDWIARNKEKCLKYLVEDKSILKDDTQYTVEDIAVNKEEFIYLFDNIYSTALSSCLGVINTDIYKIAATIEVLLDINYIT